MTKQLISIFPSQIADQPVQICSACDLAIQFPGGAP